MMEMHTYQQFSAIYTVFTTNIRIDSKYANSVAPDQTIQSAKYTVCHSSTDIAGFRYINCNSNMTLTLYHCA